MRVSLIIVLFIIIKISILTSPVIAFQGEELKLDPLKYFTPEQIELGKTYKVPKYWMFFLENILLIIFLLIFILTPVNEKINIFLEYNLSGKKYLIPLFYSLILITLWNMVIFPLNFYRGYLYENRFNLLNQGFLDWFKEYLLARFIFIIIFVLLVTFFYFLVRFSPEYWWIWSGAGFGIFVILGTYLLPVLIFPLFNKFEPLPEGKLKDLSIEIGRKAGINGIKDIYIMDASRQSSKGNAFFVGLFGTTRIVLYDTLKNYSLDETASIIAHEAGHWKHKHIIKGILLCIFGGFFFLFVMSRYISIPHIKIFPLILLILILVNLCTLPAQNIISRYFERQADLTSLEITGNPQAFIKLEEKLAIQNLSEITPSNFIVWYLFTHPPVMERIAMAESLKSD